MELFGSCGRVEQLDFKLDKKRLNKKTYPNWEKAGLKYWQDRNGNVKNIGDKIQYFVCHKQIVKPVVPIELPTTPSNAITPTKVGVKTTK